ncbi:MAG: iron ABC transporter permease [Deltaproteobacteria bacterium]|jgi:iron complex transport system permease protein|nr:iron ABC transporter permease [Deltaproteobacteria bacterium]
MIEAYFKNIVPLFHRTQRFLDQRSWAWPWLLALVVVVAVMGSMFVGAYPMPLRRPLDILLDIILPFSWVDSPAWDLREITVVTLIRPPRIMVAVFAGITLGMSGTALQGMYRNPLVGPDLIGVSSGAAFGGALAYKLALPTLGIVTLASIGGVGAMLCTLFLARIVGGKSDGLPLILAGFFVGAFFMACVGLILHIGGGYAGPNLVYWLLGTFRGADPTKAWTIILTTTAGGILLMALRWRLNLLSLGDLDAKSLGLDVGTLRWILILVVSIMVAVQVAVSGVVGWVGLIIPHCARMLVGPDHRRLMPVSALLGCLLVLGLDNLTRTVIWSEIPVGVLSGFLGTPFICFLFWKCRSRGWS